MTEKQQAIFEFVRKFFREHDKGPTAAEVASALGHLNESTIRYNLKALERADYLRQAIEGGATRWSPTGERALVEAELWRMVDQGLARWSGGKPKGARRPIKLAEGVSVSDLVIAERDARR